MSISAQPKLIIWIASNKWKVWRIINSIVMLISFFIPWVEENDFSYYTVFTYFGRLDFQGGLAINYLLDPILRYEIRTAFMIIDAIGLAAILIYCVLNMILSLLQTKYFDELIWAISTFFLMALTVSSLRHQISVWFGWKFLLWGYWLTWIGLASSIILEISYFLSKRKVKDEVTHQSIS